MIPYSRYLADDGFVIFLFHGVIRCDRHKVRNYTGKHLALDRFVEILRDLRAHGSAVSMPEIVAASEGRTDLPPRAFAISFDDGFENNFTVAAPVLNDMKMSAIFYVTTGFIAENSLSWTDLIEFAIENAHPCVLDLPCVRGRFETASEKIALLEQIRVYVKSTSDIDPYSFAAKVWKQLGVREMIPDPDLDQKLSWTQVEELARHPLFTVGGHGHTHRILSFLPPDDLEREIACSVELLTPHLPPGPLHYSYPEGLHSCYSDAVISALKSRGVVCSPTAEPGVNKVGEDLFRLRRYMVSERRVVDNMALCVKA